MGARPPTRGRRARGPASRSVFAVDANCLVATVSAWHEHHHTVWRELTTRLAAGEEMVVPLPALTEAFSVLTRMPKPQRLNPRDAWTSLEASVVVIGRVWAIGVGLRRLASHDRRRLASAAAGLTTRSSARSSWGHVNSCW